MLESSNTILSKDALQHLVHHSKQTKLLSTFAAAAAAAVISESVKKPIAVKSDVQRLSDQACLLRRLWSRLSRLRSLCPQRGGRHKGVLVAARLVANCLACQHKVRDTPAARLPLLACVPDKQARSATTNIADMQTN